MLSKGTIVCSKAGRDSGSFSAVLSSDDRFAVLTDGSGHPIEKPKRKNVKHIAKTLTVLSAEQMSTNSSIKKALEEFGANKVKGEI